MRVYLMRDSGQIQQTFGPDPSVWDEMSISATQVWSIEKENANVSQMSHL